MNYPKKSNDFSGTPKNKKDRGIGLFILKFLKVLGDANRTRSSSEEELRFATTGCRLFAPKMQAFSGNPLHRVRISKVYFSRHMSPKKYEFYCINNRKRDGSSESSFCCTLKFTCKIRTSIVGTGVLDCPHIMIMEKVIFDQLRVNLIRYRF